MPAIAEPREIACEHGILSKTQKLAALLVMLGPESAAVILKQFQPQEVVAISHEMGRFNLITPEQQQEILMEFSNLAAANAPDRSIIQMARHERGPMQHNHQTSNVLGRMASTHPPMRHPENIADVDPRSIFNAMRGETPQTIAFILKRLLPEKAEQVLNLLPPEQRNQIIERLATITPAPVEVSEKVMEVLYARLDIKPSRAMTVTFGPVENNSSRPPNSVYELV
jgi:flagellar motor switch protein FliG